MHRLLLIRHAKAAAFGRTPGDHGRPLSAKGRKGAQKLGRMLDAAGWTPDLAILSDSQRTIDTWQVMDFYACAARAEASLYLASPRQLEQQLARHQADGKTLALLAHNPGIALMAQQLIEEGFDHDAAAVRALAGQFKTGWAAAFEMREEGPRLAALFDPRRL